MDAISTFHIKIDFSDRDLLYDYARKEYVSRPVDGWTAIDLTERAMYCPLGVRDRLYVQRMRLLDEAHNPVTKGTQLKEDNPKSSEEEEHLWGSVDDLNKEQELPNRMLPVYRPGDVVRGELVLNLERKLDADQLKIAFIGQASVKIRSYNSGGFFDDFGSERFVDEKILLWQRTGSRLGEIFGTKATKQTSRGRYIDPGMHSFPFQFRIPKDASCSCPPLLESEYDHAHIAYTVKGLINASRFFGAGNLANFHGIWVEKPIDIAALYDYKSAQSVCVEKKTGMLISTGKITCKATIPRTAFVCNDEIPIRFYVNNSVRKDIECISCRVILSIKARTHDMNALLRSTKSVCVKGKKVIAEPIPAMSEKIQHLKCPVDFTDTILDNKVVPISGNNKSKLISTKYCLVIKLKRSALSRNVEMKLPLTIGSFNSEQTEGSARKEGWVELEL